MLYGENIHLDMWTESNDVTLDWAQHMLGCALDPFAPCSAMRQRCECHGDIFVGFVLVRSFVRPLDGDYLISGDPAIP